MIKKKTVKRKKPAGKFPALKGFWSNIIWFLTNHTWKAILIMFVLTICVSILSLNIKKTEKGIYFEKENVDIKGSILQKKK